MEIHYEYEILSEFHTKMLFLKFEPAPGIAEVENVTDVDRWPPWRWLFMRPTLYRLALWNIEI